MLKLHLPLCACGVCVIAFSSLTELSAQVRQRAEIPAEFKWDFSPIYPDWAAWEVSLGKISRQMDEFAALKGTLAQGPQVILGAYRAYDEIGMESYRAFRYPGLQRDVDQRDNTMNGRLQRVQAIFAKFGIATAWFTPELLTIPQATMEQWISETPELGIYRFTILDNYRQQQHVLDEKGEKLLSYGSRFRQTPGAIFQDLSTADIKFSEVTLSDGTTVRVSPANYQLVLMENPNQADRAKVWEAHHQTYAATLNTYASIYNSLLQRDWFNAQARNYPDTLTAALDGNNIPAAVVENLIASVKAGTAPLRRYERLRQKLLKLETYHLYDDLVAIHRSGKKYPYDECRGLVMDSVTPLGADYQEKMKTFLSGGRVDVYESEGKRSGAYCAGVYGVGPYLLLNHNDTLDALFTLAHEAGHAMHTVLSHENQPFVNSDYTIFVAEVASTTNERLLLNRLLETATDPKERFLLLQHAVDGIVRTFYRQVIFADYELQAHRLAEQGKPVTAEVLNALYLGLLKDYYGDSVTIDDLYKVTWARVPHFYNSPYYVYQYATCFASSAQLFKEMTTGDEAGRKAATERYLTLLKSGGNDYPMEQLKKAGIDLTKPEAVRAVIEQMDELVTQLEKEAAKIE